MTTPTTRDHAGAPDARANARPTPPPPDAARLGAQRRRITIRTLLIPLLCLLCVTLPHLDQGDWRTDTGRYAALGLQCWTELAQGNIESFWSLHLQPDREYWNKPPLMFWTHGLALWALEPNVLVARLPSVAAACLCCLSLVLAVRRHSPPGMAVVAGIVLALSYGFFNRSREISLDMWQAAFFTLALAVAVRADGLGHRADRPLWLVLAGIPIGLCLMVKPFMGLLALPILAAWLAIIGRRGLLPWLALTTIAAVLVALPWHLAMVLEHGGAFIDNYLGREVVGRAQGAINVEPWWYYASEVAQKYWPWLPVLLAGPLLFALRRRIHRKRADRGPRDAGLVLALLWAAVWTVLLSIFPDKRPRYMLLLYPAYAWIVAWALFTFQRSNGRRLVSHCIELLPAALIPAAVVLALIPIRVNRPPGQEWDRLFAFLESRPEPFIFGAFGDNDQSRWYLRNREWPEWIGGDRFPTRDHVPPGWLILDEIGRLKDEAPLPPGDLEVERITGGFDGDYRVVLRTAP